MKKVLVLYYSWSNGNTEKIAKELAEATKADIEKIDTLKPYVGSYQDVVDQGQKEVNEGYKPALKTLEHNIDDYDIIAVGTPTWWYTMAPAVKTLLEDHDFSSKTVVPFMTNGGWPGHVINDMKKAVKGANVECPFKIQFDSNGGDTQVTKQADIEKWISKVVSLAE